MQRMPGHHHPPARTAKEAKRHRLHRSGEDYDCRGRPLAETFERERDRMYREKLPAQMMKAMTHQLRLVLKRK